MKINGNIELVQNAEIRNAVIERYAGGIDGVSLPTGVAGRIIFNTDDNQFYIHSGVAWSVISEGVDAPAFQYIYDSTANGGANITHVVNHNINQRFVVTSIFTNPGVGSPPIPEQIIPAGVFLNSANQLTVTFDIAINCYVVVMGVPGVFPA